MSHESGLLQVPSLLLVKKRPSHGSCVTSFAFILGSAIFPVDIDESASLLQLIGSDVSEGSRLCRASRVPLTSFRGHLAADGSRSAIFPWTYVSEISCVSTQWEMGGAINHG